MKKHVQHLCAFLLAGMTMAGQARTFTDQTGRKLEAEIVEKDPGGTTVTIRLPDGRKFPLPIATLSAADQAFVKQWQPQPSPQGAAPQDPKKDAEAEDRKVMRILEDVVIAKWDREALTFRWLFQPQFEVTCPDAATKQLIEKSFSDLISVCKLKPGPAAQLRKMTIIIDTTAALRKLKLKEAENNGLFETGYYMTYGFGDDRALDEAIIYACSDKYSEAWLKSQVLGMLVTCFGFPERTRELEPEDDSTLSWYLNELDTLPAFDKKLLAFFYEYIPPGTKKAQLRQLFRKHWKP